MRKHRTRMECPSLPPLAGHRGRQPTPDSVEPERMPSLGNLGGPSRADAISLTVTVRVLYFSQDGEPADYGSKYAIQTTSSSTVGELLGVARSKAGVSSGRLLFRMKPLKDKKATLEESMIVNEPSALHLMVSRKSRTAEVEKTAADEAAKLAEHTAAAAASVDPGERNKKKKLSQDQIADMKAKAKAELGSGPSVRESVTSSPPPDPAIAVLKGRNSQGRVSRKNSKDEQPAKVDANRSLASPEPAQWDEDKMDQMLQDADGFRATAQNFLKGTLNAPLKARKVEMDEHKVRNLMDEADAFNTTALNFLKGN